MLNRKKLPERRSRTQMSAKTKSSIGHLGIQLQPLCGVDVLYQIPNHGGN